MAEEAQQAPPPPAPAPKEDREKAFVIIRPYPKIVYLYPTWMVSLAFWFFQPELTGGNIADHPGATLARWWLAIFTINILVIAFEFSRIRSVAISFFLVAFVFAGMQFGFLSDFLGFLGDLQPVMNKTFYLGIGSVFTLIYLLVFINTRFNYWEIQPNEILHHHGFLGDVHRYPTRGLRMTKEISDVFEYVLLRAGRLIMDPHGATRPITLENVISLNKVEDKIQRLLGTLKVRVDDGRIGVD